MADEKEYEPPFPLGHKFKYLGVDMIVTRYHEMGVPHTVMVVDYVARSEIVRHTFHPCDYTAVEIEAARAIETTAQEIA